VRPGHPVRGGRGATGDGRCGVDRSRGRRAQETEGERRAQEKDRRRKTEGDKEHRAGAVPLPHWFGPCAHKLLEAHKSLVSGVVNEYKGPSYIFCLLMYISDVC
jgi:hypothetical protein